MWIRRDVNIKDPNLGEWAQVYGEDLPKAPFVIGERYNGAQWTICYIDNGQMCRAVVADASITHYMVPARPPVPPNLRPVEIKRCSNCDQVRKKAGHSGYLCHKYDIRIDVSSICDDWEKMQ